MLVSVMPLPLGPHTNPVGLIQRPASLVPATRASGSTDSDVMFNDVKPVLLGLHAAPALTLWKMPPPVVAIKRLDELSSKMAVTFRCNGSSPVLMGVQFPPPLTLLKMPTSVPA